LSLEQDQQAKSDQLYNLTYPGLQSAENFYTQLSTGNPQAIQTATAPATEQIAKNYQGAIQNIQTTMPRGGAQDLAVQQAEISKAGQIGSTDANAYLGSFPALAGLAQGGIGLSESEISQALSAFGGASSSNTSAAQMSSAGKAETLSFVGGLGQSAATGAGLAMSGGATAGIGKGCWLAELVFGEHSLRTARLRVFLNQVWGKTFIGRKVMWLYNRYGRWVAAQARKRNWLRRLFVPVFLYADTKAFCWEYRCMQALRNAGAL
jgi:hypothetical protein